MTTPSSDPWSFLDFAALKVQPPITTNSIKNFDASTIRSDAQSTHIVIHPRFPDLAQAFLAHKRHHGSPHEKRLYSTAIATWQDLTARLLAKRPLVFMGGRDHTVLRDGTMPRAAMNLEWTRNGTDAQDRNTHLSLAEYLSYDEIALGALLGVSGPSWFVNDGDRYNRGAAGKAGTFVDRGVIVGLVGARFERRDRMDAIFCLNVEENGPKMHPELRAAFQHFFGVARSPQRSFDVETYKARMRVTAEMLLLEGNARAADEAAGRKAYVYVVGLGLGVWQVHPRQPEWYLDAFRAALEGLALPAVGTVEFAYIPAESPQHDALVAVGAKQGIRVRFSRRNPAAKLPAECEGQLLVLSYAWDGNAFPGNEYWQGSLSGSGDPAAACMSTVGELHNPVVNPGYLGRVKVVGRDGYA